MRWREHTPWRWIGCSSLTSPPGIETSMTEFSGRVYTLPCGRRDCTMRLPLRICRRTGTLRGMERAQLIKNSISFYRSRSAILRTVHEPIPHCCTSRLEGRLTKERLRLRFTSSPPGWDFPGCCQGLAACADDDHKLTASGFRTQFFLDSRSILALDRRT